LASTFQKQFYAYPLQFHSSNTQFKTGHYHVDHTINSSEDDIQDIQNYNCIKAKTEKPILKVTGLNFGTDSPFLPDVTVHYTITTDLHEAASALFYKPDVM
jgi:hypothetical protein